MLLQTAPPDTSAYMIAGYVVFVVITAIYLVSLFVRRRNLEQDLSTLESLQAESNVPAKAAPPVGKLAPAKAKSARPKTAKRKQVAKKITRRR